MLTVPLSVLLGMSSASAEELCGPGFAEGGGCCSFQEPLGNPVFDSITLKFTLGLRYVNNPVKFELCLYNSHLMSDRRKSEVFL